MRGRRLHVKPGLAEAGPARRARSCQRFGRPRPSGGRGTSEAPGQGKLDSILGEREPVSISDWHRGRRIGAGLDAPRRFVARKQWLGRGRQAADAGSAGYEQTSERFARPRKGGSHCVAMRVHIPLLGFCRQTNDAGDTKGLAMSQAGDSRAERRARKAASPQPLRPSESGDCSIRHLQAKQSRPRDRRRDASTPRP